MADRAAKTELFEQYARVGKALSAPKRLDLLDLLAQGERTVDALARAAGVGVSTASMHLQTLRQAGLVRTRKEGTSVHYRLAGDDVAGLYADLRDVAIAHLADADRARAAYLGGTTSARPRTFPGRNCFAVPEAGRSSYSTSARTTNTRPGTSPARCRCRSKNSSSAWPSCPQASRWSRTAVARTACSPTTRSGC